jgi:hypothetical protein
MSQQGGVFYIALGERYYVEACASAASVRRHMPDLPIAIATDQTPSDLFDQYLPATPSDDPWRDKIRLMAQSPFEYTLFLDTDTRICADCRDVFELLERFDMACAPDAKRLTNPHKHVPPGFCEMNTGVLVYRQSDATRRFFEDWLQRHDDLKLDAAPHDQNDQPSFRWALYETDLRIATLPMAYHCRYLSAGLLDGPVKILHGREADQFLPIERVETELNRHMGLRVFVAGRVIAFRRSHPLFAGRTAIFAGRFTRRISVVTWVHVRRFIRERGVLGTLRYIMARFRRLRSS